LAIESAEGLTRLRAEAIIGADGPRSMVRARMGLKAQPLAFGMEYELPLAAPSRVAQVHFAAEYGAGYAWVFPHGQTAGVGLALDEDRRGKLRQLLDEFVDLLKGSAIEGCARSLGVVSGPIPVGGPAQMTVSGALMLAGDAAGQTNPLTGAGLYSAVACGQMAGRAAAKAVKAGDISLLQSYEKEWRDLFGALLERSLCGRNGMAGASAQDFRGAVARAWRLAPRAGKKGAAHGRAQAPGRGIQA
jgi:flavin-dependent dehydrogenase